MGGTQVHYEIFSRKTPVAGWSLCGAMEDRAQALAAAHEMMTGGKVAAVKVHKESLNPDSGEYQSLAILTLGAAQPAKAKKIQESLEPLCVSPQDLYSLHARDRIGRLLEAWLERKGATAFELLHRADLVEQLEASGTDLQHAIQKVSIPEAQARGLTVHELIRSFQALVERAIERLIRDTRRGAMPDLDKEGFAKAVERVAQDPERSYLLGAGVAVSIAPARNWSDKIGRLLDLIDAAPGAGPARALAFQVIEQPLAEIVGSRLGLNDLLGRELELGARLAAMTRLAAIGPVESLMAVEASVSSIMPPMGIPAQRLAERLADEDFASVKSALAKRVVQELTGPRRLCPGDPGAEIAVMRALAMALTAAAGTLIPLEDVQNAFVTRSQMLVTSDFVETYLGSGRGPRGDVDALIWLTENVIGGANKRAAGRFLAAQIKAMRLESDLRDGKDSPAQKLQTLATWQRAVARGGLAPEDFGPMQAQLGELGGRVEADSRLVSLVTSAPAGLAQRLVLLLRLAIGETAPLGPAADRARVEALKMARLDETRTELAGQPERMAQVRDLLSAVSAAA